MGAPQFDEAADDLITSSTSLSKVKLRESYLAA